jgi:hypothetical protein
MTTVIETGGFYTDDNQYKSHLERVEKSFYLNIKHTVHVEDRC